MPRRSLGKTRMMVTITSGWITPAAKPCMTRPRITKSSDGLVAHMMAPAAKMVSTMVKVVRAPKTPTNHALSSWLAVIVAMKAVAMNWARSWPTPKAPITLGTATLTMVPMSTMVNEAVIPVTVTRVR